MKETKKIFFIGTGSGKTSLKRFHSSFLITLENYNLLIDAGDGISKALLSQNINYNIIDAVLISHLHPDHYTGLPALLVQMKMNKRENELSVFLHKNHIDFIKDFINKSYLFIENLGFGLNFAGFEHEEVFKINKYINFLPKQNSHLNKYKKYDINKNLNFECSSFLFNINGVNLFYTGDIADKDDLYLFRDFKMDYLITEVTHINYEDILLAYNQLKPGRIILTHISDGDEKDLKKLSNYLSKNEQSNFITAYDGLTISLI